MKRQLKYPTTSTFEFINVNPKGRITGDCSYRAIARATETPWEQVVKEMADLSIKTGYAVGSRENIDQYLKAKGWKKMKQPRRMDRTKYTGEEFCKVQQKWLNRTEDLDGLEWGDGIVIAKAIIASIGGHHITSIINGKVNDIWNCTGKCVGNYWTKGE